MADAAQRDAAFHYMRVEVTAAAALVGPDERIVGDNMVDATLVFGWRTGDPGAASDEQINGALSHQISPVLAVISAALTQQGWLAMGQADEPMSKASATVVGHGKSSPVRVFVMPDGAKDNA